jgi:FKBP-type peptidyl-prolyl cis-trans isomerase FklB
MLLAVLLAVGCSEKVAPKALGSDAKQRADYSIGYQLGKNLKAQHSEIDVDPYVAGLRDGLAGAPAKTTEKEIQDALAGLRTKALDAQKTQRREEADKNRAAGEAFLESNKKRDGVKVLPSGLQYKVVHDGTGAMPTPANQVTVNYRSALIDGKELSTTFGTGKPVTVDLGRVIPAWREALPLMREGARWELFVPPKLAYGQRGSTGIEPESTLVFDVEVVRAKAEPHASP